MKNTTRRSILRAIHIVFGLTIFGYVYGPPSEVQQYAPYFRFIFVPVILLSGFWMWKGDAIRRKLSKKSD